MNLPQPNWSFSPLHGEPTPYVTERGILPPLFPVRQDGATITDHERGLVYEAVIDQANGKSWLTSLTIRSTKPGQRIDRRLMQAVPVARLAEQVSLHLAAQKAADVPLTASKAYPEQRPTVKQVAEDYVSGLGRREIAHKHHASVHTIDKRIREARSQKLIAKPTTGRGHKTPGPKSGDK